MIVTGRISYQEPSTGLSLLGYSSRVGRKYVIVNKTIPICIPISVKRLKGISSALPSRRYPANATGYNRTAIIKIGYW